jgi:hypothetical protein
MVVLVIGARKHMDMLGDGCEARQSSAASNVCVEAGEQATKPVNAMINTVLTVPAVPVCRTRHRTRRIGGDERP